MAAPAALCGHRNAVKPRLVTRPCGGQIFGAVIVGVIFANLGLSRQTLEVACVVSKQENESEYSEL